MFFCRWSRSRRTARACKRRRALRARGVRDAGARACRLAQAEAHSRRRHGCAAAAADGLDSARRRVRHRRTPGDAREQGADVDAVIGVCTPDIVAAGKSIRWIQLTQRGRRALRLAFRRVRERNILVTNMQRIGGPIIAEHVIAMALAFTRGLDLLHSGAGEKRMARASTPPGRMTVVERQDHARRRSGRHRQEVAQRAHALGMRVIATRASGARPGRS